MTRPGWRTLDIVASGAALLAGVIWLLRARWIPVDWPLSAADSLRAWSAFLLGALAWHVALVGLLAFGISSWRTSGASRRAVIYVLAGGLLAAKVTLLPGVLFWQLTQLVHNAENPVIDETITMRVASSDDLTASRKEELMVGLASSWYVETGESLPVRDASGTWTHYRPTARDDVKKAEYLAALAKLRWARDTERVSFFTNGLVVLLSIGFAFRFRYRPGC